MTETLTLILSPIDSDIVIFTSMLNHWMFLLDAKGYLHQNADICQAGGENGLNLWSHKMDSKAGYVLGV